MDLRYDDPDTPESILSWLGWMEFTGQGEWMTEEQRNKCPRMKW